MTNEALGLWNLGVSDFHDRVSVIDAKRIIKEAYRGGLTTFDSAYSYTDADSILHSAVKELDLMRTEWRIIEKIMPVPTLRKKADSILKRLHTSFVDILLIHWPSEEESLYKALKTLEGLKEEGKTREIGVSNFPLPMLEKISKDFQVEYHERPLSLVWNRDYEEEKKLDIKTLAYAPLGFGVLTETMKPEKKKLFPSPEMEKLRSILKRTAENNRTTVPAVALSWVKRKSPYMIIRGASSPSQLSIPDITLREDEYLELDALSSSITAYNGSDNIFNHDWRRR